MSVTSDDGVIIEQAYLDTFFSIGAGLEDLCDRFVGLFESPSPDDGLDQFKLSTLRDELVAKDPSKVIEFLVAGSRKGAMLAHTRKKFRCTAAGVRILESAQFPFLVAHVWFKLDFRRGDMSKPEDVDGHVLAGVQDVFHALGENILDPDADDTPSHSAAVISILASVEPSLFARMRAAWDTAVRPDAVPDADLWSVLPDNWRLGDAYSIYHTAQGAGLHAMLGTLYDPTEVVQQGFSITFQDAGRKPLRKRGLPVGDDEWFSPDGHFLSSRRGSYYRPRPQHLGMLLLLDQWTGERIRGLRVLEQEIVDRLVRRHEGKSTLFFLTRFVQPRLSRIGKLCVMVANEQALLRKGTSGAISRLRHLMADDSISSGVEVPACHYPVARHGGQKTVQTGLVKGLADRTVLRIEELSETTSGLARLLNDQILVRASLRQAFFAVMTIVLTGAILALTAVLVFGEIGMP